MKRLFKQIVLLCARLGMVNLGHVALDGTKLKANTSKHKAMSYGRMKQEEQRLEREIGELMRQAEEVDKEEDKAFGEDKNGYNLPEELQRREGRLEKIRRVKEELEREKRKEQGLKEGEIPQIEDREQRSFADKDARIMLMKRGEFDYAYNAQAVVDETYGVLVAADLSNEASDMGHLPEMVEGVRQLRDELVMREGEGTTLTADSGYFSAENINQEGDGIELLIASGRESKEERTKGHSKIYCVERFDYDKEKDAWRCPGGRLLIREERKTGRGQPPLRRYICEDCSGCNLRRYCLKPGEEKRVLLVKRRQLVCGGMRFRLKLPEKQAIYRRRKWVGEQVFGNIKEGMGFRGVTMRREVFARTQWLLACAVHNVIKAMRFILNEGIGRGEETALAVG
jgi:hypothetical protein